MSRRRKHRLPGWLRWTLGTVLAIAVGVFIFCLYGFISEHLSNKSGMIISGGVVLLVGAVLGWHAVVNKVNNRL
jgi:uncharacterized membrane protein